MKSKYWVMILAGILAVSALCCIPLLQNQQAVQAKITSGGELVATVRLSEDQQLQVTSPAGGYNTIVVQDGKIAVTEASCPDHHCVNRGFCSGGTAIVCLPNQLVIEFEGDNGVDGAAG